MELSSKWKAEPRWLEAVLKLKIEQNALIIVVKEVPNF